MSSKGYQIERMVIGLICFPAILFQGQLVGITIQMLYCIGLAILQKKTFRIVPNLLLITSVSIAHLLQPLGLTLYVVGSFPITLGALLLGLRKAFTIIAMIYLSHFMVAGRPQFPGFFGALLSTQFFYFDRITLKWKDITPKRPFIGAIDTLLLSIEGEENHQQHTKAHTTISLYGGILHIVILWGTTLFFLL